MNLCFSKEIFEKFLSIQSSPRKSSLEIDLANIFENVDSNFILSENYLDLLQKELEHSPTSQQYLEVFFTELFDYSSGRIIVKKNNDKSSAADEFMELAKDSNSSDTILLCRQEKPLYKEIKEHIVYYDNLKSADFFDLNHLKFRVAARGVMVLTNHDFSSEAQVNTLISNFISINYKNILIFSRDYGIHRSNAFANIPKTKTQVQFYGRAFISSFQSDLSRENIISNSELTNHKQDLKSCFGSRLQLFITNKVNMIHERRILVDNWILTVDDDFNNLIIKRPTWTVTINYSPKLAGQIMLKTSSFRPFT